MYFTHQKVVCVLWFAKFKSYTCIWNKFSMFYAIKQHQFTDLWWGRRENVLWQHGYPCLALSQDTMEHELETFQRDPGKYFQTAGSELDLFHWTVHDEGKSLKLSAYNLQLVQKKTHTDHMRSEVPTAVTDTNTGLLHCKTSWTCKYMFRRIILPPPSGSLPTSTHCATIQKTVMGTYMS
jgi:hypothetical protein